MRHYLPLIGLTALIGGCAAKNIPAQIIDKTPLGALNLDVYEGEPSNTYALIIGVNDYQIFDESVGNEAETSDLKGAVNDANLWWRMTQAIGVPAPRTRVLTTPGILDAPFELGPGGQKSELGNATHDKILEGVDWLAAKLGEDPTANGLITFSGHGLYKEGVGKALGPSDLSGSELDNAISYADIADRLRATDAQDQVTLILDACHAKDDSDDPTITGRALVGAEAPADAVNEFSELEERILSAASEGNPSYEAYLGGMAHGAFTWSMVTLTERWEISREDDRSLATVSYGELVDRSGRMLEVLGFEQTPEVYGGDGVEDMPFLSIGTESSVATDDDPNRALKDDRQLHPDVNGFRIYSLRTGGDIFATIAVVGEDDLSIGGYTLTKDTEYWKVDAESWKGLDNAESYNLVIGAAIDCGSDDVCSTSGADPECDSYCQDSLTGDRIATTGERHDFTLGATATWTNYSGTPSGDRHFEADSDDRYMVVDFVSGENEVERVKWYKSITGATFNDIESSEDNLITFERVSTGNAYPLSDWDGYNQAL